MISLDSFPVIKEAIKAMDYDNGWSGMFSLSPELPALLEKYKDRLPEIEKTLGAGQGQKVDDILTKEEIAVDPLISPPETACTVFESMTAGCGNVNDLVKAKYPEWLLVDEFLNEVFDLPLYNPRGQ